MLKPLTKTVWEEKNSECGPRWSRARKLRTLEAPLLLLHANSVPHQIGAFLIWGTDVLQPPRLFPLLHRRVTGGAQRLPVGAIPEHRHVTSVRLDVVHQRRRSDATTLLAHGAQRTLKQECLARLLPCVGVTALARRGFVSSPRSRLSDRHRARLGADPVTEGLQSNHDQADTRFN